ncbi:MAG TPA: hypothetical protein VL524_08035 [Gemmatimonadaceae bacterium]|jgi:hypothetical protein|nr:hypothetical protein [Gemmatimonadaceae bacterium]
MATIDRLGAAPIPRSRLWRGLYLAPLAWAVAFAIGYVLVSRSCEGDNGMHARGIPGFRWIDLGVAVVMACVAAVGLLTALGSLREARQRPAPDDRELEVSAGAIDPEARGTTPWWGRERFMARAGVIGSSLFLAGTLLFVIPPLVLNVCSQAR